jgi:hypothetical protein
MDDSRFASGMAWFFAALLLSSVSSLLEYLPLFGSATSFVEGFCDGLSVIAYGAAVFLLVRSCRQMS